MTKTFSEHLIVSMETRTPRSSDPLHSMQWGGTVIQAGLEQGKPVPGVSTEKRAHKDLQISLFEKKQ